MKEEQRQNSWKYSQCIQGTLLKIRYFEQGLSKNLKNYNSTFEFEPSLFLWELS